MSKAAIALWSILIGAIVTTSILIPTYLLEGWVLVHLWTWFITSSFHNAPALTLAPAIGIIIIVNFLTQQFVQTDTKKEGYLLSAFNFALLRPFAILAIGYVVHSFM